MVDALYDLMLLDQSSWEGEPEAIQKNLKNLLKNTKIINKKLYKQVNNQWLLYI